MTTVTASSPHARAMEDLLQAERALRTKAEGQIRQYVGLLTEIASALDGERLEEERLSAPDALAGWDVNRWRKFFSPLSNGRQGWGQTGVGRRDVTRLEAELADLRRENEELKRKAASLLTEVRQQEQQAAEEGGTFAVSRAAVVEALKRVRIPADLDVPLGTSPTSRERALKYLYLVYAWGISTRMEIGYLLALQAGTSVNSAGGKAKKVEARLAKAGLLVSEAAPVPGTDVSLAVVRLTEEGRTLCARMGWQKVVSEWERFEGSVAWLGFLMQARIRGYAVRYNGDCAVVQAPTGERWVAAGRAVTLDASSVVVPDVAALFSARLAEAQDAPLFTQ